MCKRGVVARVLFLVLAVALLAGCSEQVRRLQGQNQQLINDRDTVNKEVSDLKALLDQDRQQIEQVKGDLARAQADVDYWKGQAEAYGDATSKIRAITFSEEVMRQIAKDIGAPYIPGGGIRLASDVLFDPGKAELKESARDSLKKVAGALSSKDLKGFCLRVEGHTDSDPIRHSAWKDNMQLSQARARAVWLELKTDGVSGDLMYTAGWGEFRPIDDNKTSAGKASNRRVELWLEPSRAAVSAEKGVSEEAPKAAVEEVPEPSK